MKIRNDQLQALQQQQGETRVKPGRGGDFESLLAARIGEAQGTEAGASASPLTGGLAAHLSPALLGLEEDGAEAAGALGLDEVSQSIDGLFTAMDAYAASLSSPEGDLRGAYALLRNLDRDVKALREAVPDLGTRHAGLAAVVNELEVMTVTEHFKFNRGDYL
jgi:hypothetical protein